MIAQLLEDADLRSGPLTAADPLRAARNAKGERIADAKVLPFRAVS